MHYSFDTEHAKKYGVEEAIMIQNFQFWIMKNKANNKNYRDGRTWTYNSIKAMCELFPFWTEKQIRRILDSLMRQKILITGNYNEKQYDRTLWYAFVNESAFLAICPKGQMDLPKKADGSAQKGKPIPDNKPDTIPDSLSHERLFNEVQKLFPNHHLHKDLPLKKLDYFLQKHGEGKVHIENISDPTAYIKGILIGDDYIPYSKRQQCKAEQENAEQEKRERERQRLEAIRNDREIPEESRKFLNQLYGRAAV